ncbi:hypothetical protein YTPLAS18_22870 [Nitrospira sp.]|nr:hypothetical protein YTPLAS18_22870 [Nitrospira sp.]
MTPTTEARVLQALGNYLKRDPATIPVDAVLRDDLGLDSMATIELLYQVEEAFDLQIPDEDLQGLQSVRDVVAYVNGRLSSSPPANPDKSAKGVTSPRPTTKSTKAVKKKRR